MENLKQKWLNLMEEVYYLLHNPKDESLRKSIDDYSKLTKSQRQQIENELSESFKNIITKGNNN